MPSQEHSSYSSKSRFLSPNVPSPRKSPSRQSLNGRKSSASLRVPSHSGSLADAMNMGMGGEDEDGGGRHHSLAHELAVALMPEPSAGSKLLAEEFGIEYDEGAEGIDEVPETNGVHDGGASVSDAEPSTPLNAASASDASFHELDLPDDEGPPVEEDPFTFNDDPVFASAPVSPRRGSRGAQKKAEQDAMEVLAQDLKSTDKFLGHLRTIDVDHSSATAPQASLEKIAADVIRRMNETVRDRESQVRELLECEREFRKIAGEVGGSDVLGHLDELTQLEDLSDQPLTQEAPSKAKGEDKRRLHDFAEEEDWETDPDRHLLGDQVDEISEPAFSPLKDSFPPPPPLVGPPTPGSTVPQLAHLRTFTTSLVSSLGTISEHAQVNGAATTEAGRKIRALKNKLGGWRTDWDSAERSRLRIERWEAGIVEGSETDPSLSIPTSPGGRPSASVTKRVDGRRIVEEHLRAFELALADAAVKTQAIMAR